MRRHCMWGLLVGVCLPDCGGGEDGSCTVEYWSAAFSDEVPWLVWSETHEDARTTRISVVSNEIDPDAEWRRWDFEYEGDELRTIRLYDVTHSASAPWMTSQYQGVDASETAGCPTSFPLPGDPRAEDMLLGP